MTIDIMCLKTPEFLLIMDKSLKEFHESALHVLYFKYNFK